MKQYANIDTLTIWSWVDDAVRRSDIRLEEQKSGAVATIEYGYRRAVDDLVSYLQQLDEEHERTAE